MNRREFLKSTLGVGTLVATSRLPVFAEAGENLFATRGRFERLILNYVHIRIGLPKPFSVLHISDTHLAEAYPDEPKAKLEQRRDRMRCFGGRQEEALRDSLAWAKENADYVVHTGDLIDWQSRANFDLVKKYFGPDMCGSMGNHEFSPTMWRSEVKETRDEKYKDLSRKVLSETYPFDISFQSTVVNGVNFVSMDDVYGYVTADQVKRFRAEVAKELPIILCLHVPFISDEIAIASNKFWMGGNWKRTSMKFTSAAVPAISGERKVQQEDPVTRDFIVYLRTEPLLKGVLAGHLHFTMQDDFSPTARQYIVGGNYMFHGQEVLFS